MLTTTWLLISLAAAGIASWLYGGNRTSWRDPRLAGGLLMGAIGFVVPPEHAAHGVLLSGSFGLLGSMVSTEAAAVSRVASSTGYGSTYPYRVPETAPLYAYVS